MNKMETRCRAWGCPYDGDGGAVTPQAAALESAAGPRVVGPVRTARKLRSGAVGRGLARVSVGKTRGISDAGRGSADNSLPGPTVRLTPLLLGLLAGGPSTADTVPHRPGEAVWARQSLSDGRVAAAGASGAARLPENMQMSTRSLRSAAWPGCGRPGLGFGVVSGSGPAAFTASHLQRPPVSLARLSCRLRGRRSGWHTGALRNPDFQGLLVSRRAPFRSQSRRSRCGEGGRMHSVL